MINIIKKEINISKELETKIKWTCNFYNFKYQIINGNLRIIEHTNLAYVEPHRLIIDNKLYLFFNEHKYFYISNLKHKIPISKLEKYITSQIN